MKNNLPKKIAIIISEFNQTITDRLKQGCCDRLNELSISPEQYDLYHVPGAVEIPFAALCAAKSKQYCGIITLGAVIRGETSHYDYVCQQVSQGCQHVMLEHELPVIFGIITAENTQQALDRSGGAKKNLGADSVDSLLHMIQLQKKIASTTDLKKHAPAS